MCVKKDIWLHKTHTFEIKCYYHKVDNFYRSKKTVCKRRVWWGRLDGEKQLSQITNITVLKDCKKEMVILLLQYIYTYIIIYITTVIYIKGLYCNTVL